LKYKCCLHLSYLKVRLADTDWCQPLEISREDTIVIAMRKHDNTQKFVKAEIRGYEEGSRFVIVQSNVQHLFCST
jgi:vacuolar protein sorting-associated protein 13A/C